MNKVIGGIYIVCAVIVIITAIWLKFKGEVKDDE